MHLAKKFAFELHRVFTHIGKHIFASLKHLNVSTLGDVVALGPPRDPRWFGVAEQTSARALARPTHQFRLEYSSPVIPTRVDIYQ